MCPNHRCRGLPAEFAEFGPGGNGRGPGGGPPPPPLVAAPSRPSPPPRGLPLAPAPRSVSRLCSALLSGRLPPQRRERRLSKACCLLCPRLKPETKEGTRSGISWDGPPLFVCWRRRSFEDGVFFEKRDSDVPIPSAQGSRWWRRGGGGWSPLLGRESGDMARSGSDKGSDASGVASAARTDRVQRFNGGGARARAFAHFRAFRIREGGADRPTVRGRPLDRCTVQGRGLTLALGRSRHGGRRPCPRVPWVPLRLGPPWAFVTVARGRFVDPASLAWERSRSQPRHERAEGRGGR